MSQEQVFISFRGRDGRFSFVKDLKEELRDNNIKVFTDEDAIRGESLENLFRHIKKSRIALVIFSKHYADSGWCLDELVEIKKCMDVEKLDAIPIFYKVKAAHVKKQSGKFGERFLKLQSDLLGDEESAKKKRVNSRIKRWKKSLVCIAGKIGLTYEKKSSEKDFIKKIVMEVKRAFEKIALEERQNPSSETRTTPAVTEQEDPVVLDVNHLGKLFHFSRPLEALNLERSNPQGSAHLAALLSSMHNTNKLRILPGAIHMNSVEYLNESNHSLFPLLPPNLEGLDARSPHDLIEEAANWLALQMLTAQSHPALILTNWVKMDPILKSNIIFYARRKSQQIAYELRRFNGGVDLKPGFHDWHPVYEEPSWLRMLDHKLPQVSYETGTGKNAFLVQGSQTNLLPVKSFYETPVTPHLGSNRGSNVDHFNGENRKEREDTTCCYSVLCYWFKCCFCIRDEEETLQTRHQSS